MYLVHLHEERRRVGRRPVVKHHSTLWSLSKSRTGEYVARKEPRQQEILVSPPGGAFFPEQDPIGNSRGTTSFDFRIISPIPNIATAERGRRAICCTVMSLVTHCNKSCNFIFKLRQRRSSLRDLSLACERSGALPTQ